MAKGKGKSTSSGPHKKHGQKKHMFRWTDPMKWQFGKTKWATVQVKDKSGKVISETLVNTHRGILSKYHDFEAWQQACQAKGKRNVTHIEFKSFSALSMEQKKEYFKNL